MINHGLSPPFSSFPVFDTHMYSGRSLFLCSPPDHAQTVWICSQTSNLRQVPLLHVPVQEVCEYQAPVT